MLEAKMSALINDRIGTLDDIEKLKEALAERSNYLNKLDGAIEVVGQLIKEAEQNVSRERNEAEAFENLQEDGGGSSDASGEASEEA